MKRLIFSLFLSVSALAGDGYNLEATEVRFAVKAADKAKPGDVLKLRRFSADFDYLDDTSYTAVFFDHKRGAWPESEIKVTVTEAQKLRLENAATVYLRRNAGGWEVIGTNVARDAKGVTVWRYY